ncbi:Rab geranylgeranyltransferase [Lecanora helva]
MASHGVFRGTGEKPSTIEDRQKELEKINEYRDLVDSVSSRIDKCLYDNETLEQTSKLLKWNPEYYTIWNHRRLIIQQHLFSQASHTVSDSSKSRSINLGLVTDELAFLLPLLRKFPKCYWIWNYRLWLLEESTHIFPPHEVRKLWQQELVLAGKMLNLDSRNFHGWGYRRTVVGALESPKLCTSDSIDSMVEQEFEYTTKMISTNLSNFSAWHNRSKLIPRLLDGRHADQEARRKFLDEGSDDQSLWFYYQYLTSTIAVSDSATSLVPHFTLEERLQYLSREIDEIQEMLECADDCKWIYQSLINLSFAFKTLAGKLPPQINNIQDYISRLINLDPLRTGVYLPLPHFMETVLCVTVPITPHSGAKSGSSNTFNAAFKLVNAPMKEICMRLILVSTEMQTSAFTASTRL